MNLVSDITTSNAGFQASILLATKHHHLYLSSKSSLGHTYKFWLQRYLLTSPCFSVAVHRDHRSLFVLCVMAQWLLGRSAMINSGRPRGRAARPGYPARDLLSLWQPRPQSSVWPELRLELAAFHTCDQNRAMQMQFEKWKRCKPLWHAPLDALNVLIHL